MKINESGLNIIKQFEGLRLQKYICSAGKLTIGYGHVILPSEKLSIISRDQAEEILLRDVSLFEAQVASVVRVDINENQFSALVSFAYNLGIRQLKESTLLKIVNNRDHLKVPAEFIKWINAGGRPLKGLVKRRIAESALYMEF